MKNIILLIIWLILICTNIRAQGEYNNLRKYWYYKTKLNNDFTKVGLNRGESMPFNERGYTTKDNAEPNQPDNITYTQSFKLGDGTSTLGYYIATLATEYYLLKQNGQRTDSVRHELFCALNAFNRCDAFSNGTSSANVNTPTALDGFFIRDDLKKDFVRSNYKHFNYYNNNWDGTVFPPPNFDNHRGFASKILMGQTGAVSSFEYFQTLLENGYYKDPFTFDEDYFNSASQSISDEVAFDEVFGTTFESQDQVYNLLFGLAFVDRFVVEYDNEEIVDLDENGNPRVFEYEGLGVRSIPKEAKNIVNRIMTYIKSNDFWLIKYPNSSETVTGTGGNPTAYLYPLAEAASIATGNHAPLVSLNLNPFHVPVSFGPGTNYQGPYSKLFYPVWQGWFAELPTQFTQDQKTFYANLAATCNCIYDNPAEIFEIGLEQVWQQIPILNWLGWLIDKVWELITIVFQVFLGFEKTNVTSTSINYTYNYDRDHAPIARKVLHGGNLTPSWKHSFDYLLDVAPCEGNYNFRKEEWSGYEWSSDNRLDRPDRIGNNDDFSGEYNGIDYLLYHNLWAIHQMQERGYYFMQDYSHQYVNRNGGNINISPTTQTFLIEGFETVDIEKAIIPDATTGAIRAGKYIHLGAGTHIGATTNAHLFIQPYGCATEPTSVQRLNNSVTLEQEPKELHHIDYPAEPIQMKQEPVKELNTNAISNTAVYEQEPSQAYQDSVMNAAMLAYVGGDAIMVTPFDDNRAWKVYFYLHHGEFANIAVMDMKGNVVATENNLTQKDNGYKIDLSDKANGMYILKFIRSTGKEETKKLLRY